MGLCVQSGQVFRWQQLADGSWLGVDGDHWFRVSPAQTVSQDESAASVESNSSKEEFERLFRLEWDAALIEAEILAAAPEIGAYIDAFPGLRIMRSSCPTESFFCFLCTPNNNLARITQMARHLATYGPVIGEVDGVAIHRFPDVSTLATIAESELRARAFGYRAATIPSAARQVLDRGEGWIDGLKRVPYEEAHSHLCSIKGIGPKLADCIALFALDHTEAIPIDTHIWQAFVRLYRPEWKDKPISDTRYREAAQYLRARFGRHGGWAQQYLFYDNMLSWRERRR